LFSIAFQKANKAVRSVGFLLKGQVFKKIFKFRKERDEGKERDCVWTSKMKKMKRKEAISKKGFMVFCIFGGFYCSE